MEETYEFSVSPIDLATEYEWEVTGYPCGAHVSNDLNYAFVYAIFPSTNTLKPDFLISAPNSIASIARA